MSVASVVVVAVAEAVASVVVVTVAALNNLKIQLYSLQLLYFVYQQTSIYFKQGVIEFEK